MKIQTAALMAALSYQSEATAPVLLPTKQREPRAVRNPVAALRNRRRSEAFAKRLARKQPRTK